MPEFDIPDMAFTRAEKKALLDAIQRKVHPSTREGVILWNAHNAEPPTKSKFTEDHDVFVREIFEEKDKSGRPKGMAGGFSYSHTLDGPIVGAVGTGFSHELKKDLWKRSKAYRGAVARIVAEKKSAKDALVKPRFTGWHPDKNDETFGESDPVVK